MVHPFALANLWIGPRACRIPIRNGGGRFAGIAAACLLLAGCSGLENVYGDMEYRYRDVGPTGRCAYFIKQAFPEIRLAETKVQSAIDINTTTTRIEGVNENGSSTGQLARNVAVECRFENGILTEFRWTAGPFG